MTKKKFKVTNSLILTIIRTFHNSCDSLSNFRVLETMKMWRSLQRKKIVDSPPFKIAVL